MGSSSGRTPRKGDRGMSEPKFDPDNVEEVCGINPKIKTKNICLKYIRKARQLQQELDQAQSQVKRYREALERITEDAVVFDNKYISIARQALKEDTE